MAAQYSREVLTDPYGLLSALLDFFPDFPDEDLVQDIRSGDANLHTVMMAFSSWLDPAAAKPSQLAGLASLMSQCIAFPDRLENAVGTCFLEHLRQIDRRGVFWKCLPSDVIAYIHAH